MLFDGDPFDLGISGGFATPLAAELITDADLVVAWGCSLTMWTTRHGALIGPDTTVVQVDDDESALGANRSITLGVTGDVGETAQALHHLVALRDPESRYRRPEIAAADRHGGPLDRRARPTTCPPPTPSTRAC